MAGTTATVDEATAAATAALMDSQWIVALSGIGTYMMLGLVALPLMLAGTALMKKKGEKIKGKHVATVFIIAGAIGNFIDRVSQGFVVDFLYFKLIHFPVFNVADIYVTCSVFVLAFLLLFYYKEEDIDRIMKAGRK